MEHEVDLIKLYSGQILALAADIPHIGRLAAPQGSASVRAPVCGSTVTVDVTLGGDRITAFAQDVKACALGQAAASVMGAHVIGASLAQVRTARDQLHGMLSNGGPAPSAPFEGLEVLRAAADLPNRHASILLCLDALDLAAQRALAAVP